ncbi:MAG: hypothetical protein LKG11_00715 [Bacilli bacterium]|jgi:hypothetical protein|nr:hypothetical protein [Bacilli bacterium]
MRLAQLAYECVKDSINFESGITLDGFIQSDFDSDRDFAMQISSVFSYINLAVSRLATNQKIPSKIEECDVADGKVSFAKGRILNLVDKLSDGYARIPFRTTGDSFGVAIIDDEFSFLLKVFVEYVPEVPHFTMDSIRTASTNESGEATMAETKVDLMAEYGIDNQMCDYIKEFVKGGMLEYISPDSNKWHTNLSEQYFAAIRNRSTSFFQQSVKNKHGGYFK